MNAVCTQNNYLKLAYNPYKQKKEVKYVVRY